MSRPPRIPITLPLHKSIVYFITICVRDRHPGLNNAAVLDAFRSAASRLSNTWTIPSAVLMPDHVHLLAIPHERSASVSHLSAALKRWTRQTLKATWQWQEGSFDHLLRNGENLDAKWTYIRENPVRAGLVTHWQEWPWQWGIDPSLPVDTPFRLEY